MRIFSYLPAFVLAAFAFGDPASAQLAIDRLWVDFDGHGAPRTDVIVRNESHDRYYITVEAVEVVNPGTPQEQRRTIANPEELGLLVTPNRLIMDPSAMRSIRVVALPRDDDQERVYRILVTPQVGEIQQSNQPAEDRSLSIKVLAAYDLLVTVRPSRASADVVATRSGNELVLRNRGNTNVLLFDGQACSAAQPDQCAQIEPRRLYAGNEWHIPLAHPDDRVRFHMRRRAAEEPSDVSY